MTNGQGNLKLGVDVAAREFTLEELGAQEAFFELAERFQGYVAQKLRELLGEPAYDQRIFTTEERRRRAEALKQCAYDGAYDARQRHANWCSMHNELGWKHGPVFDPKNKQHPNLVPWDALPLDARVKADIFALVSVFTADILKLAVQHLSRAEKYESIRVLAHMPLDENDVPEEKLMERLTAIAQLCEGDNAPYVNEVLERFNRIYEREQGLFGYDDSVAAITEVLTVGR